MSEDRQPSDSPSENRDQSSNWKWVNPSLRSNAGASFSSSRSRPNRPLPLSRPFPGPPPPRRVLAALADPLARATLAQALGYLGHEVVEVGNLAELFQVLESSHPNVGSSHAPTVSSWFGLVVEDELPDGSAREPLAAWLNQAVDRPRRVALVVDADAPPWESLHPVALIRRPLDVVDLLDALDPESPGAGASRTHESL